MDALLEPLFASLACDHQLCRAAAGKCVGRLRDFVGPGIWAGHLTDDQAAAMARSPDVPAPAGDPPFILFLTKFLSWQDLQGTSLH